MIKVVQLAYQLSISPRRLSKIAYRLRLRKYHNDWGEEFFKRRDAKIITIFFKKAEQMNISPFFLLDAHINIKSYIRQENPYAKS